LQSSFALKKINLYAILLLSLFSCTKKDLEYTSGKADFSTTIAIGGNYLAGYQDGALSKEGQEKSMAALIAQQLGITRGNISFHQALLPDGSGIGINAKYWEYNFQSPSTLGYKTDCKGVTAMSPVKQELSSLLADNYLKKIKVEALHDFSAPFTSTADMLRPSLGNNFYAASKPFYARFATNPGVSTLAADAQNAKPTFVISWLGMEDIFNYAAQGGAGIDLPSVDIFAARLDSILKPMVDAGAAGVLGNIPDFRHFPYYTTVKWDNADITQIQADSLNDIFTLSGMTHINFKQGRNGFVLQDPTAVGGYRQMEAGEYITLSVPIDSMKCYKYGLIVNVVNNRYVLDKEEVQKLDQSIAAYNSVILRKAAEYGWAMADVHAWFKTTQQGIKVDGADINLDFVSGGFFSLDGYHPHQKGYEMLANEFIKAINQTYDATVPKVFCQDCHGVKFP
jgi:hypothetical protein